MLASAILRDELEPMEPAALVGPWWVAAAAVTAAVTALWLSTQHPWHGVLVVFALGLGVLSLVPGPSYPLRASLLSACAAAGLVVVQSSLKSRRPEALPLLPWVVALLAAGLMFRCRYRASTRARALVVTGVLLGCTTLLRADFFASWSQSDSHWQIWLPMASQLLWLVLLLLSLLSLMSARSTGGTGVSARLVLAWLPLHHLVLWSVVHCPPNATPGESVCVFHAPLTAAAAAGLVRAWLQVVFALGLSVGLFQLLAWWKMAPCPRSAAAPHHG
ncbi:MAG: hypothetical protein ACPGUV_02275 [Polyangiales bacterium]